MAFVADVPGVVQDTQPYIQPDGVDEGANPLSDNVFLTPHQITTRRISEVAALYGLTMKDLLRRDPARRFAHPRQHAMAMLRDEWGWPYLKIARFFDRDHTTVLFGVRQHRARVAS
jgi:chromosomal replication initiation ATPase DnaA